MGSLSRKNKKTSWKKCKTTKAFFSSEWNEYLAKTIRIQRLMASASHFCAFLIPFTFSSFFFSFVFSSDPKVCAISNIYYSGWVMRYTKHSASNWNDLHLHHQPQLKMKNRRRRETNREKQKKIEKQKKAVSNWKLHSNSISTLQKSRPYVYCMGSIIK